MLLVFGWLIFDLCVLEFNVIFIDLQFVEINYAGVICDCFVPCQLAAFHQQCEQCHQCVAATFSF